MVTDCVIQNQEAIMKSSHVLYRKIWILRIKRVNVSITKPRIIEGINCHINTGILLCQNIKRPNIHISIYQNNFLSCLLHQRDQKLKCIINLPIKEYFLL